jgi:hypothetical protein
MSGTAPVPSVPPPPPQVPSEPQVPPAGQHPARAGSSSRAGARSGLGALGTPVLALGSVVGALVVVAVVLGFTLFGGGSGAGPASAASSPRPSETTSHRIGSGGGSARTFSSPSRNITCEVSADEARCGIADLSEKPAPVQGCDGTVGYVVEVGRGGKVAAPCVPSNQQPYAAGGSVTLLAYGKKITVGDLVCKSEKTGVRCSDKSSGKGFTLARAGIGTF